MENNIKEIQEKLMSCLRRIDGIEENIGEEVARSNAISLLANTYIKSCNLLIRVEECESNIKSKVKDAINNEE